ncbi:MAG: DUF2292 domain-containing protein [Firmicutes bacterium]|nr:DUF2292 domain-containing protein [Bacillota bacterium]MBQ3199841.1 DUF2292 domain-containing protein [Bacillota bacterium]
MEELAKQEQIDLEVMNECEEEIVRAIRQLDYGEVNVMIRNGKPVMMKVIKSQKLEK